MKGGIVFIMVLLLAASALAVPAPITHNGKEFYKVDASIADEDSGTEVCGKLGLVCLGYTEPSTQVCKLYNPSAATASSINGDASGTYCDGAPQGGECSTRSNTCLDCPTCTTGLGCNDAIGGLYAEAYVECQAPPAPPQGCPVILYARNTQSLVGEIPALDQRVKSCPTSLPSPADKLLSDGNVQLDINMNNGGTQTLTLTVAGDKVTGISQGASTCKQKVTVSESDLDVILGARDRGGALTTAYGQGDLKSSGCTIVRKVLTFFTSPITRFVARRAAPPPPPPPAPNNCRALGENCNQNPCTTGLCAAPEEFIDGRWQYVNYRCIDTKDYQSYCIGRGNTRAPWACVIAQTCQK